MPEFDVLMVAALKLFHPTASSVLFGAGFGNYDTASEREGREGDRFFLTFFISIGA
jgi:hypothetical protein